MSRLDDLRRTAAKMKEEREAIYEASIKEVMNNVLSDQNLVFMTAVDTYGSETATDETKKAEIVDSISKAVAESMSDHKRLFKDTCKLRGFTDRKLIVVVERLYETWNSDPTKKNVDFEDKLELVANKFTMDPTLWESIAYVQPGALID